MVTCGIISWVKKCFNMNTNASKINNISVILKLLNSLANRADKEYWADLRQYAVSGWFICFLCNKSIHAPEATGLWQHGLEHLKEKNLLVFL